MTITALVPAAGCGARAALNGNKVLAPLRGRPLLWHTLRALSHAAAYEPLSLQEIIIAARPDEFPLLPLDQFPARPIEGGATRQDSVFAALREAASNFVLVHDAARPLVSPQLIARVCEAALQTGAALAALPSTDTVKRARPTNGVPIVEATLPRDTIWLAQTPQVFRRDWLLEAFESAARDGFAGTDCASLVERIGHPVRLVEGEVRNFKVTYTADMARAAELLTE